MRRLIVISLPGNVQLAGFSWVRKGTGIGGLPRARHFNPPHNVNEKDDCITARRHVGPLEAPGSSRVC